MASRITPAIRVASGTGKPKSYTPRVKTTFNKKGMMSKTVKKMNRRLGAR